LDNIWHQCKRADLGGEIIRQEHTAMSTRFEALRDDGIDCVCFKPDCFFNGGGV